MRTRSVLLAVVVLWGAAPEARAEDLDAAAIIRMAEDSIRGQTAEMKATMDITTPRWKRTLPPMDLISPIRSRWAILR